MTFCFTDAAQLFWLETSLKKTYVVDKSVLEEEYRPVRISTITTELKVVHRFNYQECTITANAKIDKNVDNKLAK